MAPKKNKSKPESSYEFPQKLFELAPGLKKQFFVPTPENVVPGQIVTIDHFFSDQFCNELIASFSEQLKLETTPLIKSKDYAARFNDRVSVNDNRTADALWQYLRAILLQEVAYEDEDLDQIKTIFANARNLNPQLRIYRYRKGHHFGQHYDDSVVCPIAHDPQQSGKTKWTLLIYLTGGDEFVGGGTIFYPETKKQGDQELNIHPSKGLALLHKHGDDCLKHEAEIVKDGVKWVLRSDVVY